VLVLLWLGCARPWVVDEIDESCPVDVGDEFDLDVDDERATLRFIDQPSWPCDRLGHDFRCDQTVTSDLHAFEADAVVESWIQLWFERRDGEITGEIRIDNLCSGEDCDALEWTACGVGNDPSPFHATR
jgi:hypothetical protein